MAAGTIFIRAKDVAEMLGVTPRRIHQRIRAGQIPAVREGRSIFIPRAAWDEWVRIKTKAAMKSLKKGEVV